MTDSSDGCSSTIWNILAIIGLITVFALFFTNNSENTPQTVPAELQEEKETWREYTFKPVGTDVMEQLNNTQSLLSALGGDIVRLNEQNVGISEAIGIVQEQLRFAQRQAEEDKVRQQRDQWLTTIVGSLLGWLFGIILPTQEAFQKLGNALTIFGKKKSRAKQDNENLTNAEDTTNNEDNETDVISPGRAQISARVISILGILFIVASGITLYLAYLWFTS